MDGRDWAIVIATCLGPIFAVQIQKYIEILRERRTRKAAIFTALMTTRATRLSAEHVRALNMIDTVFDGAMIFGFRHRTNAEKNVLDAWHVYLDHLNVSPQQVGPQAWGDKGMDLFVDLLFAMSRAVSFSFDRVELRRIVYAPVAHGQREADEAAMRKGVVRLLSGEGALKMEVTRLPIDPAVVAAQLELWKKMSEALTGGSLSVYVSPNNPEQG